MGNRNLKIGLDSTVFKNRKFIDWLIYNKDLFDMDQKYLKGYYYKFRCAFLRALIFDENLCNLVVIKGR